MSRIYVASSWRNGYQPGVVMALRRAGHDVYDFQHPQPGDDGFSWSQIDPAWEHWSLEQYRKALEHPLARSGFAHDCGALDQSEVCVLVLPCGRSAHLELGYAIGRGKRAFVLALESSEPELMYSWVERVCGSVEDLLAAIVRSIREAPRG